MTRRIKGFTERLVRHAAARPAEASPPPEPAAAPAPAPDPKATEELGGPAGPEPTRYGDWEAKGRCIDF
jgi:hypothetical protein